MDKVYDIDFFAGELELIDNPEILALTKSVLESAPEYIWSVIASKTGKHHPPDDNDPGGLCWHLRKTSWVAYRMFDNLLLNTDIGVAAGLLHDIAQRGLNDEPESDYESYSKHGELAAHRLSQPYSLMEDEGYSQETEVLWAIIGSCVASHMGRWGETKPSTVEQITFHLADVAASTKGLVHDGYRDIPYTDFESLGYSVAEMVGRKEYFKEIDGELTCTFGKHEGKSLADMVRSEYSYLNWMRKQGVVSAENPKGFPKYVIKQIMEAINNDRRDYEKVKDERELPLFF